jgi:hypothetical protein
MPERFKYGERAIEYGRVAGYKPTGWPIINRYDHPQEWRDWYAYQKFRGLQFSQEIMRTRDEHTVPARSPFDFDLDFNPQRASPEVPREGEYKGVSTSPEGRERVKAILAGYSKEECTAPTRHYRRGAAA